MASFHGTWGPTPFLGGQPTENLGHVNPYFSTTVVLHLQCGLYASYLIPSVICTISSYGELWRMVNTVNRTVVLKLELYQNHLEGLLPYSLLGAIPPVSDSVGLSWSWRIDIWASSQMMLMPLLWASYMETNALEEQLLLQDREIPVISWSIEADRGPTLSVRTKARGMGRILATRQY